MPPRKVYDKEAILEKAFTLLRAEGIESVSARNLAESMKMSVAPIYFNLGSMDTLYSEMAKRCKALLLEYQSKEWTEHLFLNMGMGYILFAKKESNLFNWMNSKIFPNSVEIDTFYRTKAFELMKCDEELHSESDQMLERILLKMRIFSHGLACLLGSGQIAMDNEEIKRLMTELYNEIH